MDKYWGGDIRCILMKYVTNLEKCTFDYGDWQISGFPCVHVIRCIDEKKGEVVAPFLDNKFKGESFKRTYARIIMPILDQLHWDERAIKMLKPHHL